MNDIVKLIKPVREGQKNCISQVFFQVFLVSVSQQKS